MQGHVEFTSYHEDALVLPWAMPAEASDPNDGSSCPLLFVEVRLLRFLSLAIVHWRACLRGFERIWTAFFSQPLSHRNGRHLLRAWMFWQAQCLLWNTHARPDAAAIPLPLDVRSQDAVEVAWQCLTSHLRAWSLDRYARGRTCDLCRRFLPLD